jgi:hypothetical protein
VNWDNATPPYFFDSTTAVAGGFDRVGYCLELRTASGLTSWVWTSFQPQISQPALLGLPTQPLHVFREKVSDLTIDSNVASVVKGRGRVGI